MMDMFVYLMCIYSLVCRSSSFSITYAKLAGSTISNGTRLKLMCLSTYQPYGESCEFLVNGYVREQIRWYQNDCYDSKGGICSPFYCSCDASSKTFFLPAKEFENSIPTFGCKMRFEDPTSKDIIEVQSSITFNGTDFKQYSYQSELISHENQSKESSFSGAIGIVMVGTIMAFLTCMIWICVYLYKASLEWKRKVKLFKDGDGGELRPLLGEERDLPGIQCSKCDTPIACAYCATCSIFLCKICYDDHERIHMDHNTYQLEHITAKNTGQKCKMCEKNDAMRICASCKYICCLNCYCACTDTEGPVYITFRTEHAKERRQSCTKLHKILPVDFKYQIKLSDGSSKSRMCGFTFLENSRLAVADEYEKCLKIFKQDELQRTYPFSCEPRGMTGIYENLIAVTFAYEESINIFDIRDNQVNLKRVKETKELGKPYNICYNADHYAVEFGKGKDGFIAILDVNLNTTKIIKNLSVAYFTGNTIRLALEMTNGYIYVSDMGRYKVSCIDFEGNILWNKAVPSPRGILHSKGQRHILLANKNGDSIYRLYDKNGEIEMLITGSKDDMKSPRFLAYHASNQMLGVQVDTGDKINVFHFDTNGCSPISVENKHLSPLLKEHFV